MNKKENNHKYYLEHKESELNKSHQYYKEHREQIKQQMKKYSKSERGKMIRNLHRNNHRIKFPERDKARQFAFYHNQKGDKCSLCGNSNNLEFHHTDYQNYKGITLCKKCHRKIHFGSGKNEILSA